MVINPTSTLSPCLFSERGLLRRCFQNLYHFVKRIQEVALRILKAIFPCFFQDRQADFNVVAVQLPIALEAGGEQAQEIAQNGRLIEQRNRLQDELFRDQQRTRMIRMRTEFLEAEIPKVRLATLSLQAHRQFICIAKTPDGDFIAEFKEQVEPRILEQMQKSIVPKLPDHLVESFRIHKQALNQLAPGDSLPALPADLSGYIDQRLRNMREQASIRLT